MTLPQYVTINGTSYASANLSDAAKAQAANIQVVDAELARLQQQIAIVQTARNTYVNALIEAVKAGKGAAKEGKDAAKAAKTPAKAGKEAAAVAAPAAAEAPKKPRAPRKPKAEA